MKKLGATVLVLSVFGIMAACSQGDDHPGIIGDCDGPCNPVPHVDAGVDVAADVATKDTSTVDVSVPDVTVSDATTDVQDAQNDVVQDAQDEGDAADLDTGVGE